MKVRLFIDNTLLINIRSITNGLTKIVPSIEWSIASTSFATNEKFISASKTYKNFSMRLRQDIDEVDCAFLFTEKPYDNNYFYDSDDPKVTIISLFGWDHLTNLPRSNGIVYFIAALLIEYFQIGQSHIDKNTGCINDFWHDKTGIDSGMRAAYVCSLCMRGKTKKQGLFRAEIITLLDDISAASRAEFDIIDYWTGLDTLAITTNFDVFLCHNSKDKPSIRSVNSELQKRNVSTWLDEEQLPPGRAWQELLEAQIQSIGSVAVFVGKSGLGPWQDVEMRAFISEFVRRRCPVIPVILEDCENIPQLPLFMQQFTWVDFRKADPVPLDMLVWGVTGIKPATKISSTQKPKRTIPPRRSDT